MLFGKKEALFISIVLFVLFLSFFCLESVSASTPGNITTCQTLDVPGTYNLTQSVTNTGTCFNIIANNITLDCNGFGINYSSSSEGYGIYSNSSNTAVKNCAFINKTSSSPGECFGILFNGASNGMIYNNTATDASAGFFLNSSSNISLMNNIASNHYYEGFYLASSSNNTLRNNNVSNNNQAGINMQSSSYNLVVNNTVNYNKVGIDLELDSSSNSFVNNTVSESIGDEGGNACGFRVYDSSNNSFVNNTVSDNIGDDGDNWVEAGFELWGSNDSVFINNTVNNNYYNGFELVASSNNTFINNVANNNLWGYGFTFSFDEGYGNQGSDNCTLINNTANNNGMYGFDFWSSSNEIVINNTANNNWGGFSVDTSNNLTFVNNIANNNDDGSDSSIGFDFLDFSNSTFVNNTANSNSKDGFKLRTYVLLPNNTFVNNTANSNNENGFYLIDLTNTTFENNLANNNAYGFNLSSIGAGGESGASNNTFINNMILNSAMFDFISGQWNTGNVIYNMTFNGSSKPTTASFTFDGAMTINSSEPADADLEGYLNISKYLNITVGIDGWCSGTADTCSAFNNSVCNSQEGCGWSGGACVNTTVYDHYSCGYYTEVDSCSGNLSCEWVNPIRWIFLNVSYSEGNLPVGGNESSLVLLDYNLIWDNVSGSTVNAMGNYVYGNVTSLGVIAPMLPGTFEGGEDTAPVAEFGINPVNNYAYSEGPLTFDFRCSDDVDVSAIQLWGNWTGTWKMNYTNSSYANNTWLNITVPGFTEGDYKWAVWCNDTSSLGDWTDTNRTFDIYKLDETAPVAVQGIKAIDNYNDTTGDVTFDLECYDNVAVSTIQLWTNTSGIWKADYANSSYQNNTWINLTINGISDGINYKWAVWCNDTSSLDNMTGNRTFSVNTTVPAIPIHVNLVYPENDSEISSQDSNFTFNVTGGSDSYDCSIYLDDILNQTNASTDNNTDTNFTINSISEGSHSWYVDCDGTNSSIFVFSVSSEPPSDDIPPRAYQGNNPANGASGTDNSIKFDLKCTDNVAVDTIQLWTNTTGTWKVNYTNSSYTNNTWLNITINGISTGTYKWAVWCNDTSSLDNMTGNRTFSVTRR